GVAAQAWTRGVSASHDHDQVNGSCSQREEEVSASVQYPDNCDLSCCFRSADCEQVHAEAGQECEEHQQHEDLVLESAVFVAEQS
ncbi:unnamed protein product, partial [Musa acuminata var. zebrina]